MEELDLVKHIVTVNSVFEVNFCQVSVPRSAFLVEVDFVLFFILDSQISGHVRLVIVYFFRSLRLCLLQELRGVLCKAEFYLRPLCQRQIRLNLMHGPPLAIASL
jgi:hypothetical protein